MKKRTTLLTRWEAIQLRILFLVFGLAVIGIIFAAYGVNPVLVYIDIFRLAYFTTFGLAETVTRFIPLLLIAIGLSIPFRVKIDNIGAEGQFIIGAVAATGTAFFFWYLHPFLLISLMFLIGAIAGGLWALPIALFRSRGGFKGADVVISFLLVYPAFFILEYLVIGPWRDPVGYGFPQTPILPPNSYIPIFVILGFALAITFFIYYFLGKSKYGVSKTKFGYELDVLGKNPEAGRVAGMSFLKIAVITVLISGALAGIAGVSEVAGNQFRLRIGFPSGYGFSAIAVAWLGMLNPLGIMLSSLFFAGLLVGGLAIQISAGLPATTMSLFNGVILLFVLLAEFFTRYRLELRVYR